MTERGRFATALSGLRQVASSFRPDCRNPGFEVGHDHEESVSAKRLPRGRFSAEAGSDVVRRRAAPRSGNRAPSLGGKPFRLRRSPRGRNGFPERRRSRWSAGANPWGELPSNTLNAGSGGKSFRQRRGKPRSDLA